MNSVISSVYASNAEQPIEILQGFLLCLFQINFLKYF